jgi:hypothetical protein
MKKSILILVSISILAINPSFSQGLLNKVKSNVSKEISGTNSNKAKNSSQSEPEPKCACADARLIMELGGKFKIDYHEISVSIKDDGSILVYDKMANKYYVSKDGVTQGPYSGEDQLVKSFQAASVDEQVLDEDNSQKTDYWLAKYPSCISRSGDKYLIKFNGKNYGPYAMISDFAVPRSKDKFAAIITENMIMTEDQGKKMEEAMKNAKTDQERMELSMKYSKQAVQQINQAGGAAAMTPKLISNVVGAINDVIQWTGMRLNGSAKYDDIVMLAGDKIVNLMGKTLLTFPYGTTTVGKFFVSSSNDKYANYNYGTLTFSDKTTLSELFNPYLTKNNGRVYIAYMYYSPGKNAIMQCLIPF